MADEVQTQVVEEPGQEPEQEQPDVAELLREIKMLRKENAKWRTQLRATEEQQQAKAKAEMTELERLQAELKEAQEARTRAEVERRNVAVRSQVVRAAAKLGFADPDDAYRMLDVAALDVDDAGNVDGLDGALRDLLKSKPYLGKQSAGQFSPTNPSGGAGRPSDQEILSDIYGVNRKSNIWSGPGGGVVWTTTPTE